ncbi:hypothetical protein BKA69DRAFT_1045089 [Paraphysoderma sedebokerense]|nr:hypothetical protein BKA69DRAFT_1045089 [Paraphysoderma sedebokerense]
MKNGKGNSVDKALSSSVSFKTIAATVGMAFVFQQLYHAVSTSSLSVQIPSAIVSHQKESIASLAEKNQKLIETTEIIAEGFEKLWTKAGHLVEQEHRILMEDFLAYFGVEPIHNIVVDPAIQHLIDAHNIYEDPYYKENAAEMEYRVRRYKSWIERGTVGDKRFYVKFTDNTRGYGLFANSHIRKGDVLGVYTAELTNRSWTTDYTWTYHSSVKGDDGKPLELGLDAKEKGNWFRFVNHADKAEDLNCEVAYVPYNNIWQVLYVATAPIAKDQEILVSYGESYWQARQLAGNAEIKQEKPADFQNVLSNIKKFRAGVY